MNKQQILDAVNRFDESKDVIAQMVATDGSAYNCYLEFMPSNDKIGINIVTLSHPDLTHLPSGRELEARLAKCTKAGHVFSKLLDHPLIDGVPLCPHCAVLDKNKQG